VRLPQYSFSDNSVPRWVTASYHVDFDAMSGADKFWNV
jgi:splicing factor 3B subunit 3